MNTDGGGGPFHSSPPNWSKTPNYSKGSIPSTPAGKIPPDTTIKEHGKDQPHTPSPRPLRGEGLP